VLNGGECTVTAPWKMQLQGKMAGGTRFQGLTQQRGTSSFEPGSTTLTGTFCYVLSPDTRVVRAEFTPDSTNVNCNPHAKSLGIAPCPVAPTCSLSFPDVPVQNTFYNAVNGLASLGAASGFRDGSFRPDMPVTRGQLAKMVVLAFGYPFVSPDASHFADVDRDNPFFAYIETAYAGGVVTGYVDGSFRPYANVTRAQVAKVVVLAAQLKLQNPAQPTFSDVAVGSTFYTYIETAYSQGLLSGYSDGSFRPSAPATRGQVARLVVMSLAEE
jgi:hypothetical protein